MKISNELKKIAVIPVYNEELNIKNILGGLEKIVNFFILINDGSTDRSNEIIKNWRRMRENVFLIDSKKNRGMSWAVREGLRFIQNNQKELGIQDNDIVIQIDADAQHFCRNIDEMIEYMKTNHIDYLITRRILNGYPFIKIIGNRIMSRFVSLLTSNNFYDVESGFRLLRVEFIPQLLSCTIGYRYSWAQEMAIVASKIGLKVDNAWEVPINYYRKRGTRISDALINCLLSFIVRFNFHTKKSN